MDIVVLRKYIDEYKNNFEKVNKMEIYKWKAVKHFQDNWDIEASNFREMLLKSFDKTKNLLNAGQYFPFGMLDSYSSRKPEELRLLFRNLYDEERDIYQRIEDFRSGIQKIHNSVYPSHYKQPFQDQRAIVVYLTLRFPERYFFYKYGMFEKFVESLKIPYKLKKGDIGNIGKFNSLCEIIRNELSNDPKLLLLHQKRLTEDCYKDENLNILTQDFIYFVSYHLKSQFIISSPSAFKEGKVISASELSVFTDSPIFKGKIINFTQNTIENKRIGDLGELWVLEYEKEKLKSYGLDNLFDKIKHTAKEEGDGTGYDVQSFDNEGNKIYIEVKTTKGKQEPFYITRAELERSRKEKDKYYLYRLYNYREEDNTAELLIIKGDLSYLCDCPLVYKVHLKDDFS